MAITQTPDVAANQTTNNVLSEKDILVDKKFSDQRENLRSL